MTTVNNNHINKIGTIIYKHDINHFTIQIFEPISNKPPYLAGRKDSCWEITCQYLPQDHFYMYCLYKHPFVDHMNY